MKIYFAGSIRGGRDDKKLYLQLIQHLAKYGQVLTEHIGDQNLSYLGENGLAEKIYNRDISWIRESAVIVAEVSTPSLGVGYEICKAENIGKKILCLYRKQENKKLSAMISGNTNFKNSSYKTLEEAKKCIDSFFEKLKS